MRAQFVYENISFERGRDPKGVIGIGLEGYLKDNSLKDKVYPASNSQRAAAELGAEFMYDIDLSKIYYLGRLDAGKISDSPDWAIKRLLPYITDDKQESRRETGAGTILRSYNTPYGKVVFEGLYGMPRYGSAWAERETVENLFSDRKINESIKFERRVDPKKAMGLGNYRLETEFHNFWIDPDKEGPNGEYLPDMSEIDTHRAVEQLNDIGVDWKISDDQSGHGVDMEFEGTIEQIAKVLSMYTGEDWKKYIPALQIWDGKDQKELWDILNDLNLY